MERVSLGALRRSVLQQLPYELFAKRHPHLGDKSREPLKSLLYDADPEVAAEWEEHASGVRPIVHHRLLQLLEDFLKIKVSNGSALERSFYAEMTPSQLLTRLLQRRPLAFLNPDDEWVLRSREQGFGGWETIGTSEDGTWGEGGSLRLASLLSYDEVALSALVSVAVPTHFVNAGSRTNSGRPDAAGSFERRGVYVGCVGARFEREGVMEWAHLMVTPEQNTPAKGYGPPPEDGASAAMASPEARQRRLLLRAWANFYGRTHLPTHEEALQRRAADPGAYLLIPGGVGGASCLLDIELYKARIRAVAEPFLLDANRRAREANARAYVHVVGLGLGAWMVDQRQGAYIVDAYADVLAAHPMPHIGVVDFSWFPEDVRACGGAGHNERFVPAAGAAAAAASAAAPTIVFSRRNPADRLPPPAPNEPPWLLVAMYAWDGNSYPGNEFWLGLWSASGDPAAACCSTITLLQNPDVNPTRLSGDAAVVYGPGETVGSLPRARA